jgi:hypothetical protein
MERDRSGSQKDAVKHKRNAGKTQVENTIIEGRMQLVCNTVNTDSNELDRLYPESIGKCECE